MKTRIIFSMDLGQIAHDVTSKTDRRNKKRVQAERNQKIKAIQKIMLLSFIYVCSFHSMLPLSFFFLIIISHSYNNVRQMMLMRYIQSIISNLMHEKYLCLHLIFFSLFRMCNNYCKKIPN